MLRAFYLRRNQRLPRVAAATATAGPNAPATPSPPASVSAASAGANAAADVAVAASVVHDPAAEELGAADELFFEPLFRKCFVNSRDAHHDDLLFFVKLADAPAVPVATATGAATGSSGRMYLSGSERGPLLPTRPLHCRGSLRCAVVAQIHSS